MKIHLSGQEKGPNIHRWHGTISFRFGISTSTDHPSNECKRRKLKCSGGSVCARCSRDQNPCVYATNRSPVVSQENELSDDPCVSSHQTFFIVQ
jgi:hypothetical protein